MTLKMIKNRPKMGASAPSFRDTPSKNFLGFFQPIWVGEKNWPFFRQPTKKIEKPQVVVISLCRVFASVFFLDFGAKNPKKPHFWIFFFGHLVGFYRFWVGFGVLTNGFRVLLNGF